jgi:hypothetical protein
MITYSWLAIVVISVALGGLAAADVALDVRVRVSGGSSKPFGLFELDREPRGPRRPLRAGVSVPGAYRTDRIVRYSVRQLKYHRKGESLAAGVPGTHK